MGKDAPDPPDYRAAAEEQAQASRENLTQQNYANRPTQNTPWGTTSWETNAGIDPATGQEVTQWTQNTTLDPRLDAALQNQFGLQEARSSLAGDMYSRVAQEFAPIMDWSGFMPMGGVPVKNSYDTSGIDQIGDPYQTRQQAEDAAYQEFQSRLDPQYEKMQSQLEAQLRAQGMNPGDAAYQQAMSEYNNERRNSYDQARRSAFMEGRGEAESMFGMMQRRREQAISDMLRTGGARFGEAMQASKYQNQLRQQQIAEEMQKRGFTLNEINALLTGQQVGMPQMPRFEGSGIAETPQYMNAANMGYQGALNSFNAEQQALQGWMTGAGSIAGGFMPM